MMKSIWNSKIENSQKIRTFKAIIELILLYGSKCWIIDSKMRKKIDGCYTRLLRMATNISWKYKVTNTQLYRDMPKISEAITHKRLQLAGHGIRHTDELVHNLMLWKPKYGIRNSGRQPKISIDILKNDCDCEEGDELRPLMMDRERWKVTARSGRVRTRLK